MFYCLFLCKVTLFDVSLTSERLLAIKLPFRPQLTFLLLNSFSPPDSFGDIHPYRKVPQAKMPLGPRYYGPRLDEPYYVDGSDRSYDTETISSETSGGCGFGSDNIYNIGCSSGSCPSREDWDKYHKAFRTVKADRGAQYPCSQRKLDEVQYLSHSNTHRPVCCTRKAVADAIRYNSEEPDTARRAAIGRLQAAMTVERLDDWPPDLTIKMFADLDVVFFGGWLLGNTTVEWGDDPIKLPPNVWGFTEWANRTGQCRIVLNAKGILVKPKISTPAKQAWATLLHEMCQWVSLIQAKLLYQVDQSKADSRNHSAYIITRKRLKKYDMDQSHGHDEYWRTIMHAVHRPSWQLFRLRAIDHIEEDYHRNHLMSHTWDKYDNCRHGMCEG